MTLSACRSCGSSALRDVLSLGDMPLANALPSEDDLGDPDPLYPLEVVFCEGCSLLQLTESVPPPEMFSVYAYFSSRSEPMVTHARDLVQTLIRDRSLGGSSFVVELASNDGYLLQHYVEAGIEVLGIDPAENIAEQARARGVDTLSAFFTTELARTIRAERRSADVIHANNVLAHVPGVNDFVAGVAQLLADDGVFVVETPYVGSLLEGLEFDTIYHEHVFYYSLRAIESLFTRNGLTVIHVDRIPIHGGSLRIRAQRRGAPDASVSALRAEEERSGMGDFSFYEDFAARVHALTDEIEAFLSGRAEAGRIIAGYGAAAKATVMLNATGVGPEVVRFVVDDTPYKQGRFVPGVRIPILSPSALNERNPDDVMIFAWNFADEIMAKEADYVAGGGTFLVPLPRPHVA